MAGCFNQVVAHPKSKHHLPIKQRFESFFVRGAPDECWLWQGAKNNKGYGHLKVGRAMIKAHRLAVEMAGRMVPAGLHVLHSCDNPSCVNPRHLSAGTNSQNQDDAWDRGRKGGVTNLSRADLETIKRSALSQSVLAARYAVHQSEISRLKSGKRGRRIARMRD